MHFSFSLIIFCSLSYLLYFRGVIRLDIGVVISRDFRSARRWRWSAVIFVRVCEVESKHILGVFYWRVVISGGQRDKHHAILKISLWNAPDGVFDPKRACFAIHHGFGDRVELHWFTVALFKGADWNEDRIIDELAEKHNAASQKTTCDSNTSSFMDQDKSDPGKRSEDI